MGDRAKKIVFFVVVGLLSLFLALMSEGFMLQHTAIYQTPGMYIGELLFPAHDWDRLTRQWLTWIAVDSFLWFVIVWQVVKAAERFRERHSRD
jgi:peptidoglycan/LPS O-acetylase OafA/YrhL